MAKLTIKASHVRSRIHREIYGHFSEHLGRCIYGGIYVGENSDIPNVNGMRCDVVEALRQIRIPVLRWPGGCFADEYHWKDGIGPKEKRKKMINTHWGGVVEDNSFGTHEFFELCDQLGCEAYVNGNLGSGTVQEMSEWVEYMTFDGVSPMSALRAKNGHPAPWKVHFFGVGNENWGCGGNMLPDYYANEYRRYQTYVRNYRADAPIQKICCGSNDRDYEWTDTVLSVCTRRTNPKAHGMMDGLSLHYYTVPGSWEEKGSALIFDREDYYETIAKAMRMDEFINGHTAIMDRYDPEKQIGLIVDEWGTWYEVEPGTNPGFLYQQNTMRDAMVAGLTLNIFNKHSDRVRMANLAQVVNVLQSVLLTEGDRMIKTPTYHVFDLYKVHQGADLVESTLENTEIGTEKWKSAGLTESASLDEAGVLHLTLTNLSDTDAVPMDVCIEDYAFSSVSGQMLSGEMHAYNSFEDPDAVHLQDFQAFAAKEGCLTLTLPPCSVVMLELK